MSMKRDGALLIAGCGYLGSRVATAWIQSGRPVHAVTRGGQQRAKELLSRGIVPVIGDLSSEDFSADLPGADIVLWSVGFQRGGASREDVWLNGLRRFIKTLPSAPRRFLYVSSTSVYGDGGVIDETSIPEPQTEGGICCVQAEDLARELLQQQHPQTQLTILRHAGIYGPGRLLRRMEDIRQQIPVSGQPDGLLNLIHVEDAVRMICFLANCDSTLPEIINVVNSGRITRSQFYSELSRLLELPQPVFADPDVPAAERGSAEETRLSPRKNRGTYQNKDRRIISRYQLDSAADFHFNDIFAGLRQAVDFEGHTPTASRQ